MLMLLCKLYCVGSMCNKDHSLCKLCYVMFTNCIVVRLSQITILYLN